MFKVGKIESLSEKLDDSKNNAYYYVHVYTLVLMYALVNFT